MLKFIMVGNVGKDAEMRLTKGGASVASFSLAHTRKWKDSTGAKQQKVTWVRVTAWNKLAELVAAYVRKGDLVCIECSQIEASAFVNREGDASASIEVTLDSIEFLSHGSSSDTDRAESSSSVVPIDDDKMSF
jgi:single-strand DNA-binding protein